MTLGELLRTGLMRAHGARVRGVRSKHLTDAELDELLRYSLDFLWEQRTKPSPIDGWSYSAGGIRAEWERVAQLTERGARSIRPLRTEVYDLLEERGLIVNEPGNNVRIYRGWSTVDVFCRQGRMGRHRAARRRGAARGGQGSLGVQAKHPVDPQRACGSGR